MLDGLPVNGARRASLYALMLMVMTSSGCDAAEDDRTMPPGVTPSPSAHGAFCTLEMVKCGSVATTTAPAIDYAILTAAESPKGLVLAEPGGPGFDLYTRGSTDFTGLPDSILSYDILMLREPWASKNTGPGCPEALRTFGEELSGRASALSQVSRSCTAAGWSAVGYVEAVDAVLKTEKRDLVGIVGQSYGALPAAEAARAHPRSWLVLNAPIAPASISGGELLHGRQAAFQDALNASYAEHCKMLKTDCSTSGTAVATTAVSRMSDRKIDERTTPLRTGDVELAVMAASYDLDANGSWLWRTLTSLPEIDAKDWATLGRLSDQLLQRSGGVDVSPRMAAYLAGICQSYANWPHPDSMQEAHILLRAITSQCVGAPSPANWSTNPKDRDAKTCILLNKKDPVAKASDGAKWTGLLPEASVVAYSHSAHLPLNRALEQTPPDKACPISF